MKSSGSYSKKGESEKGTLDHNTSFTSIRRGRRGSLMESASQFSYHKGAPAIEPPALPQMPLTSRLPALDKKGASSSTSISNSKVMNGSLGNTLNESLQFSSLDDSSSAGDKNRMPASQLFLKIKMDQDNSLEDQDLIRKYFKDFDGETIIKLQIAFLYFWFGLIMLVGASVSGSSITHFLYSGILLYGSTCWIIIQVFRVVKDLYLCLYASSIPFIIVNIVGREMQSFLAFLWWIYLVTVCLQVTSESTGSHFVPFILYYSGVYIGCEELLRYFERETSLCNTFSLFCPLSNPSPFSIYIVRVVFFMILGTVILPFGAFIGTFSDTLVERENAAKRLQATNQELEQQLIQLKNEGELDLDTPMDKVILMLRDLTNRKDLAVTDLDKLNQAIQILSSNNFFAPEIDQDMDHEVKNYLNTMVATATATNVSVSSSDIVKGMTSSASLNNVNGRKVNQNKSSDLVNKILSDSDSWSFNIFDLKEATEGQPLLHMMIHLFEKFNFFEFYKIDPEVFRRLLTRIESRYHQENPYHNNIHAADVAQTVSALIAMHELKDMLTLDDCMVLLFSAAVHDVDHPGVNNAFLMNSSDPLSICYNDSSILENYHCTVAFQSLYDMETLNDANFFYHDPKRVKTLSRENSRSPVSPDGGLDILNGSTSSGTMGIHNSSFNIFSGLPADQYRKVRSSIISTVLATDMGKHFEYIGRFKNKISGAGFNLDDSKDRQLIMDICIKCGDISNPAKERSLSTRWSYLIAEEFFRQGDREKQLNITVSMFMDRVRDAGTLAKCQIGFIDFIVTPLFEAWDLYMTEETGDHIAVENIKKNRAYWDTFGKVQ